MCILSLWYQNALLTPLQVEGAVSGYVRDMYVVCGGVDHETDCYIYDIEDSE